MELNDIQRLAVAEAMGKAIRDMTNPRGGAHGSPTLRTECDDALREMYETEGVDRKRIVINGQEVGTLSARISKPESGTRVVMDDRDALVEWLLHSDGGEDDDQVTDDEEEAAGEAASATCAAVARQRC